MKWYYNYFNHKLLSFIIAIPFQGYGYAYSLVSLIGPHYLPRVDDPLSLQRIHQNLLSVISPAVWHVRLIPSYHLDRFIAISSQWLTPVIYHSWPMAFIVFSLSDRPLLSAIRGLWACSNYSQEEEALSYIVNVFCWILVLSTLAKHFNTALQKWPAKFTRGTLVCLL